MKKICFVLILACALNAQSQNDSTISKTLIDTASVFSSMTDDLAALKDLVSETSSYFNVNASIGNQLFSKNNFSLNSQQSTVNTLSFKPGAGYYHKSGFSLSGLGYLNLSNTKGGFYQYSITPAYDYNGHENLVAGISYTHYFTPAKDTIPGFATPYDHEFYAYTYLSKGIIQPGIAFGYATGKYTGIFRGKVQGPLGGGVVFVVDSQKTKQADLSFSVSVQHDFTWYDVIARNADLSFTPTLMLNTGSSKTTVLSHSNKIVNNIVLKRPNNKFSKENAGFEVYSLGLSLNLLYEIGRFYIQPEAYLDYYLPQSDKKITSLFSVAAGLNL
ncbi:MAG: hypothetical protein ABIX01_04040 [Chitinophagaceae bacterium]